jgi:hypothetical protein
MIQQQEGSDGRVLFRTDDDILNKINTLIAVGQVEELAVGESNGTNKTFFASQEFNPETLKVYSGGVLKTENTDYYVLTSSSISFVTAPSSGVKTVLKYTKT